MSIDPRDDVKVSTTIPAKWADALEQLAAKRDRVVGKRTKSGMLRAGLRLYLQHQVKDERVWSELDLGPIEIPSPPGEVIDSTAEEIPEPWDDSRLQEARANDGWED